MRRAYPSLAVAALVFLALVIAGTFKARAAEQDRRCVSFSDVPGALAPDTPRDAPGNFSNSMRTA